MSDRIEVVSVNISAEKGTIKHPVPEIVIDCRGVVGDAHAGAWHRQVSLLSQESIDQFVQDTGHAVGPGEFAENITLHGIDLGSVSVLDRFQIGEVEIEVSQIGKTCHGENCAIFREVGQCVMPRAGIFCRVLSGGIIRPGDSVEFSPKTLSFKIITLSDRAYRGDYSDRSGPRVRELLEEFFAGRRWRPKFEQIILPDDPDMLRAALLDVRESDVDFVFTTGGTGIGPRDTTPEVITEVCDKIIPGIMDHIRLKFGADKPNALLSRSVAGVAGTTLIYALPGSVHAVEEYVGEIVKTMEHALLMVHGLDAH
ncbi:MAG: molybdopterin-binding protein [Armatimonadetes bacterium]|nr:molybdopterin-binding protein [Armatimonadota bacterium]